MSGGPELCCVVTTIQEPTACMKRLDQELARIGGRLVVVGDTKGPPSYELESAELVSIAGQDELGFALARLLPKAHYARKNVGYLLAVRRESACIYETDDDNAPKPGWRPRSRTTRARPVRVNGWFNVFSAFTDERIWPRGFPLHLIGEPSCRDPRDETGVRSLDSPIQQGLADVSPDVDAVWRLVLDRDFRFAIRPSVWLAPGTWCPFNSQSTWWWPPAYALMYLPSNCSFRMTDIWRSFVAQRCLWELGHGVVFHGAEVDQDRNRHDLMHDFRDEIPGYLGNAGIAETLEALPLKSGAAHVGDNMLACYEALVARGDLPGEELKLVSAWLDDLAG